MDEQRTSSTDPSTTRQKAITVGSTNAGGASDNTADGIRSPWLPGTNSIVGDPTAADRSGSAGDVDDSDGLLSMLVGFSS